MASVTNRKKLGAYYTPSSIAAALIRWVVRQPTDRLLDPACGDGRFIEHHPNSVGVDCNVEAVLAAKARLAHAEIHLCDFFEWAAETSERFDCVVGNPPFIRYQSFTGSNRLRALQLCRRIGVVFSGLTSSWAPFLAVAASLLKPGGRFAFLVPAEIGHAPYARPLLRFLTTRFKTVRIIAVREKLFPDLSEDVWIVHAEGFGGSTEDIQFSKHDRFDCRTRYHARGVAVSLTELAASNYRLRTSLLPPEIQSLYQRLRDSGDAIELGKIARIGIGYVTGANDFFHLRPTAARFLRIPGEFLVPTVRNNRSLPKDFVTPLSIRKWMRADDACLLLRIQKDAVLPKPVIEYLESPGGIEARSAYKCRMRKPWYAVPDVRIPHAFLSYMVGERPQFVVNNAECTCTNSVLGVRFMDRDATGKLAKQWNHPLVNLSCEIEGHPLGGGMLKIEPGEAARILVPDESLAIGETEREMLEAGIKLMRRWRHYA